LLTQAGVIGRTLQELQRVDSGVANLVELHSQSVGSLRELQTELSRYAEKVDVNPARLAELEERLDLIHSLRRKYGATLIEVIVFGDEAKQKLQSLESRDAELARINSELQKLDSEISKAGQKLSAARKKIIPQLAKAVSKQLEDLGFQQSKFDVQLKPLTRPSDTLSPSDGERDGVRGRSKRVAIFDFDVHHGNGTEDILLNRDGVAFFSIHQFPCYPGTGAKNVGSNCFNYPVAPSTPREGYCAALARALADLKIFSPDLIAVSAGFDAYARDPLAEGSLLAEDFYWLGKELRTLDVPFFSLLEGGYSDDLPALILAYLKGIEGIPET
jgi:hypothetical protein